MKDWPRLAGTIPEPCWRTPETVGAEHASSSPGHLQVDRLPSGIFPTGNGISDYLIGLNCTSRYLYEMTDSSRRAASIAGAANCREEKSTAECS